MQVHITKHALERFRLRAEKQNTSSKNLEKKLINLVSQSKFWGFQDGGKELRSKNGFTFVCKYENGLLTVLTVLLSKTRQRQCFSNDLSEENIDFSRIGIAAH